VQRLGIGVGGLGWRDTIHVVLRCAHRFLFQPRMLEEIRGRGAEVARGGEICSGRSKATLGVKKFGMW
jgi:hypothetical protein